MPVGKIARDIKSLNYYQVSLDIARDIGNLGTAYRKPGDYNRAIEYYINCLEIAVRVGDRRRQAIGLESIGNMYSDIGYIQKAIEYYEKALAFARETGDKHEGAMWT